MKTKLAVWKLRLRGKVDVEGGVELELEEEVEEGVGRGMKPSVLGSEMGK